MSDRPAPFQLTDEKATLLAFLDYLRESVALKALGLSRDDAARPMVPSGTSLLGLVKHLTQAERWWFSVVFAGDEEDRPDEDLLDSDDADGIVAAYRAECERGNAIAAACDDLEARAVNEPGKGRDRPTLRWVLVHMVEETARHAGHADILRELIDGSIGR